MANYGPVLLDFSPIANLGNTFLKARGQARQELQEEEASDLLSRMVMGGGLPDAAPPQAPAAPASGGMSISALGGQGKTPTFAAVEGTSPSATAQGLGANASDRAQQAMAFLTSKGWTPAQAAGIVGNLQAESGKGLKTDAIGDQGTAFGVAQWRLDRQAALRDFAQRSGADPSDFMTQLAFLDNELKGSERFAGEAIRSAQNPRDAAIAMIHGLRPAGYTRNNPAGGHNAEVRVANALALAGGSPADLPAAGAQNAQGFAIPGQGARPTMSNEQKAMIAAMVRNPSTRQAGLALWQQAQKGVEVKTVDLGNSIGIMDNQGNILRQIPKQGAEKWSRLNDGTLYNPATGETRSVGGQEQGGPFRGNAVDAQALNYLVQQGRLTPEQAAEIAAGKQVTDPSTGQILFMTPSAIVGGMGGGQPVAQQGQPQPQASAGGAPQRAGVTALTAPKPEKPTEGQATTALYANRAQAANQIIQEVETAGLNLQDNMAARVPFGVGNYLVSPEFQRLDQAQRDFVNAVLRKESGAVINQEEFDNARRQYFPQPGDGPEVIEQKRRNRALAVQGLANASGPAAPKVGGDWTEINGVKIRRKQ